MIFKNLLLLVVLSLLFATDALLSMDKKRKKEEKTFVSDFPVLKKAKNEARQEPARFYYGSCLQQIDQKGHELHCGYYVLWHLQCLIKPDFFEKIKDRGVFNEQLQLWEQFVFEERGGARSGFFDRLSFFLSRPTSRQINNLSDEEIEKIIKKYALDSTNQVSVIHAQNQLEMFFDGIGLTDEIINRIEHFRDTKLPQFFVLNTVRDRGTITSSTGHFILIVLYWKDEKYNFDVYDSARPNDTKSIDYKVKQGKYRPFCEMLLELFVDKDLNSFRIDHALSGVVDRVHRYLSPKLQDPQSWDFVGQCEAYFIQLFKESSRRDFQLLLLEESVLHQVEAKDRLLQIRKEWQMIEDIQLREGLIPEGYVDALCQLIEKELTGFDALQRNEIEDLLHKESYGYKHAVFREFAVRILAEAFRTTGIENTPQMKSFFIEKACLLGIERACVEDAIY